MDRRRDLLRHGGRHFLLHSGRHRLLHRGRDSLLDSGRNDFFLRRGWLLRLHTQVEVQIVLTFIALIHGGRLGHLLRIGRLPVARTVLNLVVAGRNVDLPLTLLVSDGAGDLVAFSVADNHRDVRRTLSLVRILFAVAVGIHPHEITETVRLLRLTLATRINLLQTKVVAVVVLTRLHRHLGNQTRLIRTRNLTGDLPALRLHKADVVLSVRVQTLNLPITVCIGHRRTRRLTLTGHQHNNVFKALLVLTLLTVAVLVNPNTITNRTRRQNAKVNVEVVLARLNSDGALDLLLVARSAIARLVADGVLARFHVNLPVAVLIRDSTGDLIAILIDDHHRHIRNTGLLIRVLLAVTVLINPDTVTNSARLHRLTLATRINLLQTKVVGFVVLVRLHRHLGNQTRLIRTRNLTGDLPALRLHKADVVLSVRVQTLNLPITVCIGHRRTRRLTLTGHQHNNVFKALLVLTLLTVAVLVIPNTVTNRTRRQNTKVNIVTVLARLNSDSTLHLLLVTRSVVTRLVDNRVVARFEVNLPVAILIGDSACDFFLAVLVHDNDGHTRNTRLLIRVLLTVPVSVHPDLVAHRTELTITRLLRHYEIGEGTRGFRDTRGRGRKHRAVVQFLASPFFVRTRLVQVVDSLLDL